MFDVISFQFVLADPKSPKKSAYKTVPAGNTTGISGSSCTLYYSVDGGTNWITRDNFTQTGPTQNNNDFTCNFEVDSGVESIKIKLVHVSSNNKNTRIDALQLKVGE